MTILLDVESRSRCDLKKYGGRKYWEHPSSEVLCVVGFDTVTNEVDVWQPGQPIPWDLSRGGYAAHNATGFDRFAVHKAFGVPLDAPYIDTSELARRAGLPGALDALGTRWLGLPKDKIASKFTKGLSSVRRPAGKGEGAIPADVWRTYTGDEKRERGVLPTLTPEIIQRVIAYCASDVEIMAAGWSKLESWIELEQDVLRVDRAVNDRGIGFDSELAEALLECDRINCERVLREASRAMQFPVERVKAMANSPQQFTEYTGAIDSTKETIDEILANAHTARYGTGTVALAKARRAMASIARGKLEAGLARVSADGRLRDMLRYWGAHTGRWGGKGFQPQNLPRPAKRFEDWEDEQICRLADAVRSGRHIADPEEIDLLVRATLVAKPGHVFVMSDFSGVESRGLAWCAGDWDAIDVVMSGRCPYRTAAATIFGVTYDDIPKTDNRRQAGKISELACGYQGGVGALENMARGMGVDFAAVGVDPQDVVNGWRALHKPIVRFWRELEQAFMHTVRTGEDTEVGCFQIVHDGAENVAIFLPSGRPIVYNQARITRGQNGRPALAFLGTKSGVEYTYGGKLTENVIQALCRDLMADALVKAEDAGLDPVLHVHDEIAAEVPASAEKEGAEYLHEIMTDLPEWASGFPIGAAGGAGKRYRK